MFSETAHKVVPFANTIVIIIVMAYLLSQ